MSNLDTMTDKKVERMLRVCKQLILWHDAGAYDHTMIDDICDEAQRIVSGLEVEHG